MPDALTQLKGAPRARPEHPCTSRQRSAGFVLFSAAVLLLAACGGGSPLDNPDTVQNPAGSGGRKLSFIYYQKCVHPVFIALLQINQNGVISTNTCAASGCHDDANSNGGAFRLNGNAAPVNVATTPADTIRTTAMYRNFYSAQGEVVLNAPLSSRLLTKPLLRGVLHGGGRIFSSDQDPNVQLIQYWITRPMPEGQDEFSTAASSMFSNGDPDTGTCNTQ